MASNIPQKILAQTTVVIPTRNRGETLYQTLQAVMRTNPAPLELIVVDQSSVAFKESSQRAAAKAAEEAGWTFSVEAEGETSGVKGRLRLVQSALTGAAAARNMGAKLARTPLVLFTDDDTFPEPDWVEVMSREFERSDVWGVYGRILPYVSGKANGTEVVRVNQERMEFARPVFPWYLGSGANMAFRRSFLLEQAGGMDEVLSIGSKFRAFEDIDIGYRVLIFGGKVIYTPASLVYHDSPKTFKQQVKTEEGYGISVGAATVKYWRCGDKRALLMLLVWIWQMAVRRTGAGLLKWRSRKVVQLALLQFWWPLVGVWQALGQPVENVRWLFCG